MQVYFLGFQGMLEGSRVPSSPLSFGTRNQATFLLVTNSTSVGNGIENPIDGIVREIGLNLVVKSNFSVKKQFNR